MQLTLVVSGLLDLPATVLSAIDAGAPALTRLLAAAGTPSVERDGGVALTCIALGIAKQHDWPVAPYLAFATALDAGARYWLCAEPATFEVGRGDVRLAGTVGDLERSEASSLLSTLNAHFVADGLRFDAPDPAHWLIGAGTLQSMTTLSPEQVIGKPLLGHLAEGADAARWRNWQNEIQMLLFEHPVNVEREAAGRAVVNSVWLWGGGARVATTHPQIATLHADAWMLRELARATGVASAPVPASLDTLLDKSPQSPAMVWIEAPVAADAQQHANWLASLERDWAAPARGAFHNGTIRSLDIDLVGCSKALRYTAKRLSLARRLRTWRSAPRLSTLLARDLERSAEAPWKS
jgi:hypothetical protein